MPSLSDLGVILMPATVWMAYLYYRDRHAPEPFWAKILTYLLGFAAAHFSLYLYLLAERLGAPTDIVGLLEHRADFLLYAEFVIGPVEELAKILPFLLLCSRFWHFDEPMDGLVYASTIAIGFAGAESLYVASELGGLELYGHALTLPLVHSLFASIWGYTYAQIRFSGWPHWSLVAAFVLSSLLHGFYDFLTIDPLLQIGGLFIIVVLWFGRMWLMKGLAREQAAAKG